MKVEGIVERIVTAKGPTVAACLAAARRLLNVKIKDTREKLRVGQEDGLYRVHLCGNIIVECTIVKHSLTEVSL